MKRTVIGIALYPNYGSNLAEQEGFELALRLTIIRNNQPLLTIFCGIPNILIPYSTTNNHHLLPS